MDHLFSVDWEKFFVPTHSIMEMVVRGTVMYLAIFGILRLIGRRQGGEMNMADILVVALLADAAQNGMSYEYASVTEGLVLVLTILAWDFVIDWLCFRVPALRRLLISPALPLIKNGVLQRRNMRRELILKEELLGHLREQGIESPAQVKLAQLEEDGQISVIRR